MIWPCGSFIYSSRAAWGVKIVESEKRDKIKEKIMEIVGQSKRQPCPGENIQEELGLLHLRRASVTLT
jgi:hypothetical protein